MRTQVAVQGFAVRASDGQGTRTFIDRLITGRAGTTEGADAAPPDERTEAASLLVTVVQEALATLPEMPARSRVIVCSDGEALPGLTTPRTAVEEARTLLIPVCASSNASVEAEAAGSEALHRAVQDVAAGRLGAAVVAEIVPGTLAAPADQEPSCFNAVAVVLTPHAPDAHQTPVPLALIEPRDSDVPGAGTDEDVEVFRARRPAYDNGLDPNPESEATPPLTLGADSGHSGLAAVAAAATAVHYGTRLRAGAHAEPWLAPRRTAQVNPDEEGAAPLRLRSVGPVAAAWAPEQRPTPRLYVFSGTGVAHVLRALETGETSRTGPARLVIVAADEEAYTHRVRQAHRWLADGRRRPSPPGVHFSPRPLAGDLAFVFPNGAAAYPGMGRSQLFAFPRALEELRRRGEPRDMADWAYAGAEGPTDAAGKIYAASFLSMVHTHLSRGVLGLRPQAVLGYSSGEISALLATGVWQDVDALLADTRSSPLFSGLLTYPWHAIHAGWQKAGVPGSRWAAYLVGTDPQQAAETVKDEPGVHLLTVNAPSSCTLGGEAEACRRVLAHLPHEYALPLDYDIAVHTPMARGAAEEWRRYFHRPVHSADGVRFYTCSGAYRFTPRPEEIADASVAQALNTIDFPGAVEQAWSDGVRVFLEHGPKERCTQWIREILGERPHLAIALDPTDGRGLDRLTDVCAQLIAAGVDADDEALFAQLSAAAGALPHEAPLPHQTNPVRASLLPTMTVMEPAPLLPPPDAEFRGDSVSVTSATVAREDAAHPVPALAGSAFAQAAAAHQQLMAQHRRLSVALLHHHDADAPADTSSHGRTGSPLPRRGVQASLPAVRLMLEASGHACLAATLHWVLTQGLASADHLTTRSRQDERPSAMELVFHGPLPRPNEELQHHRSTSTQPFQHTLHSSGRPVLTLRAASSSSPQPSHANTVQALPHQPAAPGPTLPMDAPAGDFGPEAVRSLHEGRPYDCFGPGWAVTRSHIRTPRGGTDTSPILHSIASYDPRGGHHGMGGLTAHLHPMAETDSLPFLLEGAQQALAFHLTALGLTKCRDGWRFQPLTASPWTLFHSPTGRTGGVVSCEMTITDLATEVHEPYVRADMVCAVDGTPVLRAQNISLQLVQDWPLDQWRRMAAAPGPQASRHVPAPVHPALHPPAHDHRALVRDGLRLDRASMLTAAWGRPSEALGPSHRALDAQSRVIRLPAPPYQCLTRVTQLKATAWVPEPGSLIEAEYDIPDTGSPWDESELYQRGDGSCLPPALLLEAALQPCGWLAQYTGAAQELSGDPVFRNLDGTAHCMAPVPADARVVTTRASLRQLVDDGTMVLVFFDVECSADDVAVFTGTTSFGFFPPAAFAQRTGLPGPPPQDPDTVAESVADADLTSRPGHWFAGPVRLPRTPLLILDELTGYWPRGGHAGLGRLRARKYVGADDWYFTAHFFQDPVQPGSLGVEAMYQLLRCHVIAQGLDTGMTTPRIEPTSEAGPLTWKYRGQVVPTDTLVTVDVDITGLHHHADGLLITGDGWLSVDGACIYHATGLALRMTDSTTSERTPSA
ncbi:hypothetical protein ACWGH5_16170 [Streptomyces sp. NPDC054864]